MELSIFLFHFYDCFFLLTPRMTPRTKPSGVSTPLGPRIVVRFNRRDQTEHSQPLMTQWQNRQRSTMISTTKSAEEGLPDLAFLYPF